MSTKAKVCPSCGARVPQPVGLLMIVLLVVIAGTIITAVSSPSKPVPIEPPKTAEQIAAETKEKEADLKRYSAAVSAGSSIKKALRDPASLKFESMRVSDDAKIICAKYGARNGFGGMNQEYAVFVDGVSRKPESAWNKNCTGKMYDQLYTSGTFAAG